MSKRQNDWARRVKQELRNELGNICNWINCTQTKKLQFDCIQAMGHGHHRCGLPDRVIFYRRQLAQGNLQLLCPKHHIIKSKTEHPSYVEPNNNHDAEHDDPF